MLLIRNNVDLEFRQEDYDYFKGLKNSRNPNNKSFITVIKFDHSDLGRGVSHRDVYHVDELENDLPKRGIEAMGIEYIKFMLVFCLEPGVPVLNHTHKTEQLMENHFQPVVCLSPSNSINGVIMNGISYDLRGHNSILLNGKLPHWTEPQPEPNIYLTSFGARLK